VDITVALTDGSYHPVDSSEMAFKIAASKALREGCAKASPFLLEPIMKLEIVVPKENIGDVIGSITARRGTIQQIQDRQGIVTIRSVRFIQLVETETAALATALQDVIDDSLPSG